MSLKVLITLPEVQQAFQDFQQGRLSTKDGSYTRYDRKYKPPAVADIPLAFNVEFVAKTPNPRYPKLALDIEPRTRLELASQPFSPPLSSRHSPLLASPVLGSPRFSSTLISLTFLEFEPRCGKPERRLRLKSQC